MFFLQSGQLFEVFKNHSRMHFLWKVCLHINFILSLHFPNWLEQITHFPISFKLTIFLKTQPILWWFMFRTRFLNEIFLSRGHSKQMTHFGLWIFRSHYTTLKFTICTHIGKMSQRNDKSEPQELNCLN